MKRTVTVVFAALAFFAALAAPPANTPPLLPAVQDLRDAMDRAADPCQDFHQYACGGWIARTQLPPDQTRWSRGFSELAEKNRVALRDILEQAGRPGAAPEQATMGRLYRECLDEAAVEKSGLAPLAAELERVAAVHDVAGAMALAGHLHSIGIPALFAGEVAPDYKDPSIDILHLSPGGFGLPSGDAYFRNDRRSAALRADYRVHIARLFGLIGDKTVDGEKRATAVVTFETHLAQVAPPNGERRDPEKAYHRLDRSGLQQLTPDLPWEKFFETAGAPDLTQINVSAPPYFQSLAALLRETDAETLQAYFRWRLLHDTAALLPRAFVDEDFDFYGRNLGSQRENAPRWKRCAALVDDLLGDALGKAYVAGYFSQDSKAVAEGLVRGVEGALSARLGAVAWMDDATRAQARRKLAGVVDRIGHPDRWSDYAGLQIRGDGLLPDVLRARNFNFRRQAAKVGRKEDRSEWWITAPRTNAYYDPLSNEMVFPAGILQPPFFRRDFPAAMNYGGIGSVMAHELTHGFDAEGRKFDAAGRMTDWWSTDSARQFEEQTRCVESLYDGIEIAPGVKVSGRRTLGENIADIGGVRLAYDAWRAALKGGPPPAPAAPGLTDEQVFFVAYAQIWCAVSLPEAERVLGLAGFHAPARLRVNIPLSQMPEFARAFSCAEGTPMRARKVCTVW